MVLFWHNNHYPNDTVAMQQMYTANLFNLLIHVTFFSFQGFFVHFLKENFCSKFYISKVSGMKSFVYTYASKIWKNTPVGFQIEPN